MSHGFALLLSADTQLEQLETRYHAHKAHAHITEAGVDTSVLKSLLWDYFGNKPAPIRDQLSYSSPSLLSFLYSIGWLR